jgi:hypothetical protein
MKNALDKSGIANYREHNMNMELEKIGEPRRTE